MCGLWEAIARSKPPHPYDYFCTVMVKITQAISFPHKFLQQTQESLRRELEVLYKAFRCESYIDKLRYTEAIVGFWQVKECLEKWRLSHVKREKEVSTVVTVEEEEREAEVSRPSFRKRAEKFFAKSGGKERTLLASKSGLETRELYKWLDMLHRCTFSKFSFYFDTVLGAHSAQEEYISPVVPNKFGKGHNYVYKVKNFCRLQNIKICCIVYHAQRVYSKRKATLTCDPVMGYSIEKNMDLHGCLAEAFRGIRGWPCLFFHTSDEEITREILFRDHWPNLVYLLDRDSEKLGEQLSPFKFVDRRSKMLYFYGKVGESIYLVMMREIEKETSYRKKFEPQVVSAFMKDLNVWLQNLRLLQYLLDRQPH